jgi:peroxiredoxin
MCVNQLKFSIGVFLLVGVGLIQAGCDRTVQQTTGEASSAGDSAEKKQPRVGLTQDEAGPAPLGKQPETETVAQAEPPAQQLGEVLDDLFPSAGSAPATSVPSLDVPAASEIGVLPFQPTDDPNKVILQLQEVDQAFESLLRAGKQREPEKFRENAIRLAKTKLAIAQHLANLPSASADQIKQAKIAQLVALSHLSGLKDVPSAKQLEELAKVLAISTEPELRQQGHVVQFGFALQELQNGVIAEPNQIIRLAQTLVSDKQFRSRLEMSSLQHAMNVLQQMGYREELGQLHRIAFDAFSNSPDIALRQESWNRLVDGSPAQVQSSAELSKLGTAGFDQQSALDSLKQLVEAFPNPVTLEVLAGWLPGIEYSGQVEFARQLAELIQSQARSLPASGVSVQVVNGFLGEHQVRIGWLDKPLDLSDVALADIQGKSLNLVPFQGKVIVVNFWSASSVACLNELPVIEKVYTELREQGLELLSINMDSEVALQQFMDAQRPAWPIYRSSNNDTSSLTKKFGITMFPHTLLVDQLGHVARLHVRRDDLREQVLQLLKK